MFNGEDFGHAARISMPSVLMGVLACQASIYTTGICI